MFTQSTGNNYILDRVGNEVEKLYSNYARSDLNDKWVFTIGGIRNVPTTTGFSSRVSRHLRRPGRRTSRRVTVFCPRKSRVRFSPFLSAASQRTVWRVCPAYAVVKMNCAGIIATNYFM